MSLLSWGRRTANSAFQALLVMGQVELPLSYRKKCGGRALMNLSPKWKMNLELEKGNLQTQLNKWTLLLPTAGAKDIGPV